eukprot:COSAG05_NODE_442_length_9803_cov_28.091921_7_plen_524_part_00
MPPRHGCAHMADGIENFALAVRLHLPWSKESGGADGNGFVCSAGLVAGKLHQLQETLAAHGKQLARDTEGWRRALKEAKMDAKPKLNRNPPKKNCVETPLEAVQYTEAVVANNVACDKIRSGHLRAAMTELERSAKLQRRNAQTGWGSTRGVGALEWAVHSLNHCVAHSCNGTHKEALQCATEAATALEQVSSENIPSIGALLGIACFYHGCETLAVHFMDVSPANRQLAARASLVSLKRSAVAFNHACGHLAFLTISVERACRLLKRKAEGVWNPHPHDRPDPKDQGLDKKQALRARLGGQAGEMMYALGMAPSAVNAVATLCHTVGGEALVPLHHDHRSDTSVLGRTSDASVTNESSNTANSSVHVSAGSGGNNSAVNRSYSSPSLPALSRSRGGAGSTSALASTMLMGGLGGGNYSAWAPPGGGGPQGASPMPLSGVMVQHTLSGMSLDKVEKAMKRRDSMAKAARGRARSRYNRIPHRRASARVAYGRRMTRLCGLAVQVSAAARSDGRGDRRLAEALR